MDGGFLQALHAFADSVQAKFSANVAGEPEAQLTGPVSNVIEAIGNILHRKIVAKAESRLGDRIGIPDFGVVVDGVLNGYVEVKAPGHGANTDHYSGRDKSQWERFKSQPNILYTDGNEWCLYQNGEPAETLLRFSKDIRKHGARAVTDADVSLFRAIITRLLSWAPIVPSKPKEQAELLAPLCRLLRDDVADALRDPDSPLVALAKDWRALLFPDASDERFADAYAQTVTFAVLLARSEGADVSDIANAVSKLEAGHTLLSRALQVLTDARSRAEIEPSLVLLQRIVSAFPDAAMRHGSGLTEHAEADPWLYFYEHFLAAYDPKLRKDSGVYYTPVPVVQCQVALVDDLLRNALGMSGGFAHKDVVTLDPAVGTGTYPLGVIDHALAAVKRSQGAEAVAAKASTLAANIYGFEFMTGPYAVSELRLTRALKDRGAALPKGGLGILLADTLESPFGRPPSLPQFLRPISEQHARALDIKDKKAVIVCIGNPPYDRHEAVAYVGNSVAISDRARSGGWVRWGGNELEPKPESAILTAFIEPAKLAGHGGDLKNLYNLYIYFWRWAIWKVFEQPPMLPDGKRAALGANAGIVSFITASSYIRGDAFVGMREMLRRLCHQVYVIDLGGEGRGTRRDDNVFNIQTPVAICIAVRAGEKDQGVPATVKYASIHGAREEKYEKLASVKSFAALKWKTCPGEWHAPFRPAGTGPYFQWPLLTDLMPWQSNGVQLKRTWPIGSDEDVLKTRWKALLMAEDRGRAMKESGDRTVSLALDMRLTRNEWPERTTPLGKLPRNAPMPPTVAYGYRSFDRQRLIADARLIARPRPGLWVAHSNDKQLYVASIFTKVLGVGPALTASAHIPDMDFFSNRGAKDIAPLYRDAAANTPNILPDFLALWSAKLGRKVTAEEFVAYVYGVLGHTGFVEAFWGELEDCQLRVPLTLDPHLFCDVYAAGATLLHLHTFGQRFRPPGPRSPHLKSGAAKVTAAIGDSPADYPDSFDYDEDSGTLHVGRGTIGPVHPSIWKYEVSGLRVLRSWLGYRMKVRKGKKSSDLDRIHPERWTSDFTDELLRLIWTLEATLSMQPKLTALLNRVCNGQLLLATELPPVPAAMRKGPRADDGHGLFPTSGEDDDQE